MIWLLLGVMVLSGLLYICKPLYSGQSAHSDRDHEISDYKSQIAAIDEQLSADVPNAQELTNMKTRLQRQILKKSTEDGNAPKQLPKAATLSLFIVFGITVGALYYSLGRPDLTKIGSLEKMAPPGPSAEEISAASAMTPEQRAEMIQGMVDGLSERLRDSPDNQEGWIRLLTSRKVLGQVDQANAEIERMRAAYKDRPETIEAILNASDWQTAE